MIWIKRLLFTFKIFVLGIIVGFFVNKNIWTVIDTSKTVGIWELVYYVFSILAALGTWAAVVVAIWKDSIVNIPISALPFNN